MKMDAQKSALRKLRSAARAASLGDRVPEERRPAPALLIRIDSGPPDELDSEDDDEET